MPAIRAALSDRDTNVRLAAMLALSQWHDDDSRADFEAATRSDSPALQAAGQEALRRLDALERFYPYPKQTVANLRMALDSERPRVRHEAAEALLRHGSAARECAGALVNALTKIDASCGIAELSPYLETLRMLGPDGAAAGPVLCDLLDERAALYAGRSKHDVNTLRAHLLVTLAGIGEARLGLRNIVDMLANSDQPVDFNFAAAAFAAGSLGPSAKELAPYLERALAPDFKDGIPTAGTHGGRAIPVLTSSGRAEALRALAKIFDSEPQDIRKAESR